MNRAKSHTISLVKYPAVRLVLLIIAGIVIACHIPISTVSWGITFCLITSCWVATEYVVRKRLTANLTYLAVALYVLQIISFSALWQSLLSGRDHSFSSKLLIAYTWEDISIMGSIASVKHSSTGKYQIDVFVDTTIFENALTWHESYKMRAIYDPADSLVQIPIQVGNTVYMNVSIYPLERPRNPHVFDYPGYLASQGIIAHGGVNEIYTMRNGGSMLSWGYWRNRALQLITVNFEEQQLPVANALLIGYKNELDREDKLAFSRVGLSHIMAVSGLHVGFIIAPFWFVIPFFWSFRGGKELGLITLILLLVGYAGITGFSASVTRASLTGGLLAYGRLFHKPRDAKNITAVAALIILLTDPDALFDIGFQLSFSAVYIILFVLPVIQSFIPATIQQRWVGKLLMIILVSLVVQLGLYPLLNYYFGEFSLIGPLANALIVPWLTFVIPSSVFLLLLSSVWSTAGVLLNTPNRWFFELLQYFVAETSGWQWSWVQTTGADLFTFLLWLTGLLWLATLPYAQLRWKMLTLFLSVFTLQQGATLISDMKSARMSVTILDVGQGDATHIRTPAGRNILIDTGRWNPTYNSGRYVILPYLQAAGITKLDAVFLSHPHADHIGGIIDLINEIPIDTIYNSGYPYNSSLYKSYIRLAGERSIPVRSLKAGDRLSLDPSMPIFIYGPSPSNTHTDPNERSLVMELAYGDTEFLFTGDAGEHQEERLIKQYGDLIKTDFLKVGHHGSRTSSSDLFLKTATPVYATVSLAFNNKFCHPHQDTIRNLLRFSADLRFTSLSGAIQFESDGQQITHVQWR